MFLAFIFGVPVAFYVLYSWFKVEYVDYVQTRSNGSCPRRQLGELEVFLLHLEKINVGTIANILQFDSEVSLTESFLREILKRLAIRHPLLRAKIEKVEGKYFFAVDDLNDIKIPLRIMSIEGSQWKQVWENVTYASDFDEFGLLWTVTWLKEEQQDPKTKVFTNTVIMTLHHSIADGTSAVKFSKMFMDELNREQEVSSEGIERLPLYPSAHMLIRHKVGFTTWQKILGLPRFFAVFFRLAIFMQSRMKKRNGLVKDFVGAGVKNPRSGQKIITGELSEEKTEKLVDFARKEGTTVNSVLSAIAHVVLCRMMRRASSSEPPQEITMFIAANIRKELVPGVPDQCLGNYAVPMSVKVPFTSKDSRKAVVDIAKEFGGNLKKQIDSGSYLMLHKLYESLGGETVLNTQRNPNPDITDAIEALTNIGRFSIDASPQCQYKISKLYFTVSQILPTELASPLFCNEVVTVNNRLFWTTGYNHMLVSESQAENYVTEIFKQIDAILA